MKFSAGLLMTLLTASLLAQPADLKLLDDWTIQVTYGDKSGIVRMAPPSVFEVSNERHEKLDDYNPKAGGWCRGTRPRGFRADECTTRYAYCPGTLAVKSSDQADAVIYENGKDYQLTEDWGTVGRLPDGRIGAEQPVYLDYRYAKLRIDAIVLDKAGLLAVRQGVPHPGNPAPAALEDGDVRLANVWYNGALAKLSEDNLFPILEKEFPQELRATGKAQELLPRTYAKLAAGEKVRILAWGDSVTVGTFLPDYPEGRWQERFVAGLRERFPQAEIELVTEAWGGRNTTSYLNEPSGSVHNYAEKVLAVRPDLIVSEFVNDGGMKEDFVFERYGKLQKDFQEIGAEWIILTPHYIRPDMMGLKGEKNIDQDPRQYVTGLRKFTAQNHIALADASLRWGRFWRQGIPYSSLMINAINHPNATGMTPFVEALLDLFR